MKITSDERKRIKNIEKHGLDFGELAVEFFAESIILNARDRRLKAIGILADDIIAVIFLRLGLQGITHLAAACQPRGKEAL